MYIERSVSLFLSSAHRSQEVSALSLGEWHVALVPRRNIIATIIKKLTIVSS